MSVLLLTMFGDPASAQPVPNIEPDALDRLESLMSKQANVDWSVVAFIGVAETYSAPHFIFGNGYGGALISFSIETLLSGNVDGEDITLATRNSVYRTETDELMILKMSDGMHLNHFIAPGDRVFVVAKMPSDSERSKLKWEEVAGDYYHISLTRFLEPGENSLVKKLTGFDAGKANDLVRTQKSMTVNPSILDRNFAVGEGTTAEIIAIARQQYGEE